MKFTLGNRHESFSFFFCPIIFNKINKRSEIQNKKLTYEVCNKIFKDAVSRLGLNPDDFGTY